MNSVLHAEVYKNFQFFTMEAHTFAFTGGHAAGCGSGPMLGARLHLALTY